MKRLSRVQIALSKEEAHLIDCFRQMDTRARSETLVRAARVAEDHPMFAKPTAPSVPAGIRLAASLGKAVVA